MHRLLVLYSTPKDPEHFKQHYENTHLKLAAKLPGLRWFGHAFDVANMDGSPGFFCLFEGEWDSEAAMNAALQSPEGQAVSADVPNYATGPVQLVHFDVPGR